MSRRAHSAWMLAVTPNSANRGRRRIDDVEVRDLVMETRALGVCSSQGVETLPDGPIADSVHVDVKPVAGQESTHLVELFGVDEGHSPRICVGWRIAIELQHGGRAVLADAVLHHLGGVDVEAWTACRRASLQYGIDLVGPVFW